MFQLIIPQTCVTGTVGVLTVLTVSTRMLSPRGLETHVKNNSRRRIIDIDVFERPYYCSLEVGRPRALQLQQLYF